MVPSDPTRGNGHKLKNRKSSPKSTNFFHHVRNAETEQTIFFPFFPFIFFLLPVEFILLMKCNCKHLVNEVREHNNLDSMCMVADVVVSGQAVLDVAFQVSFDVIE